MEEGAQKFLKAEETAENLVKTLKQLHTEAESYQAAGKELDAVRKRLLELIQSTQDVAKGSYEIISLLKEIGGPEILNRINQMEKKSRDQYLVQNSKLRGLKVLISITLVSSIIAIVVGVVSLLL